MSFYLSYCKNLKKRKSQHIFYFRDRSFYILKNKIEVELSSLENKENPINLFLNYIKANNIHESEFILPSIDESFLDQACDVISKHLIENDDSIGLLTTNPNFRKDYCWLLEKYGITYSIPLEKLKFASAKPGKGSFTRKDLVLSDIDEMFEAGTSEPAKTSLKPIKKVKIKSEKDDASSGLIIDEPFNTKLIKLLRESGKSNVEVYTKGGITRQVFSNIISKKDCIPRKDTVICLIIGMELNYIDGINLLKCAGYALSNSIISDIVVMKYLKRGIYNLDAINDELDERGCSLLGWKPRDY